MPFNSSLKSVWLHKWWLVKAAKGGLAVAGLVSGQSKVARVFSSDAIAKRQNRTTLETTDGYLITISDSIDRSHSLENGFPPELCNQFLFGFPYDWEDFSKCYCIGESATEAAVPEGSSFAYMTADSFKEFSPGFLDDLSATRIRDLVLSPNHIVRKRVLDDALGRQFGQDTEILANTKSGNSVPDGGKFSERTPSNKKNKFQQTTGDVDVMYASNVIEGYATSTQIVDIDVPTPSTAIATGQSTRLKESINEIPVNSSANNCVLTPTNLVSTRRPGRPKKSNEERESNLVNSSAMYKRNITERSVTSTWSKVDMDVPTPKSCIATGQSTTLKESPFSFSTNNCVSTSRKLVTTRRSTRRSTRPNKSMNEMENNLVNSSEMPKSHRLFISTDATTVLEPNEGSAKKSSGGSKKKTNKLVNNSSVNSVEQECNYQFSPSQVSANSSSSGRMLTRSQKKQLCGNGNVVTALYSGSASVSRISSMALKRLQ